MVMARLSLIIFQLREQLGHPVLDVIGNLIAIVLIAEIALHALKIVVQENVCVFVYRIDRTEYIDCDILFHDVYMMYFDISLYNMF